MYLRGTLLLILGYNTMASAAEPVSFERQIAPLLEKHCLTCHSGSRAKGGLDLTSRESLAAGGSNGPVVVPSKAGESPMIRLVTEKKMPPKMPLDPDSVDLLRQWIDEGAKWEGGTLRAPTLDPSKRAGPDWWALQPIRRLPVPMPRDREWGTNPVDAFVRTALEEKGLTFNPEADSRTLIRRVTMDLTGLWPTSEEVDEFVRDRSPNAYERLVDRLLASPAYGERWARQWLDVVRFAESHGYEMNTLRLNAWPYRDWAIRAFNADLSFDRFVREQLAGDTIPSADPLTASATGFLVAGAHDLVGNQTEEGKRQQRSDDLFDMVSTTSTAFLGLTVGCARCHDHKFDPISQRDFYAMEAFFGGVEHAERPIRGGDARDVRAEAIALRARLAELDQQIDDAEPLASAAPNGKATRPPVNARRNVERISPVDARFIRFTIEATNNGAQPCIDELEIYAADDAQKNIAIASAGGKAAASSELPNFAIHKIAHLNDGQFGNGRSWISNEAGRGWAQIELAKLTKINRVVWGRDREEKFADRLATKYRIEVSVDGKAWTIIAGSWDRGADKSPSKLDIAEHDRLRSRLAELEKPFTVYAGNFRVPDATRLLKRGDVMQPGDAVGPAGLSVIGKRLDVSEKTSDSDRRRALAAWIADPTNPLPARVMMNRVWHNHFGNGIVRTPSDFGFNGDRPSHPGLLDWLASEYRANGGHLKPIHRLIVTSCTYRQSSQSSASKSKIDADNRYLSWFPSRRIEAEAIRDGVLQASGSLNHRGGGPGYNLWDYANYVTVFTPKKRLGPDQFRRMIYQFKPRAQQDGTFGAFDCPDATAVVPKRPISTTALQALNLLNDEFMFDQADRFANRIRACSSDQGEQVASGFRLAFQRKPSDRERAAARELVQNAGLATFCRMLLNANEFVTLE
ncbi:MAG TPA: DUF1549 domain-containing protein [Gemmataceae bacterium]|jgi:hypothetical protein|nr:DUF1549 domain-containing protein [Gemmataceae bacterium]